MLSVSVTISTYGSPSSMACTSTKFRARVAYPRPRFQGTTEYPMCPRQYGGSAAVPGCHRKLIEPQKSPSHIHCAYPGRRRTVSPLGNMTGGPLASRSIFSERKRVGSSLICAVLRRRLGDEGYPETNPVRAHGHSWKDIARPARLIPSIGYS